MSIDAKDVPTLILSWVTWFMTTVIGVGLLVLFFALVLSKFGVRQGLIPVVPETAMVWLMGGWWLYRGGKL